MVDAVPPAPLLSPWIFFRMLRGGSRCSAPASAVARIPPRRRVTLVHFRQRFQLGWRWFDSGGNWRTIMRGSKMRFPDGTEAGPFGPPISTRVGALPTKSQCVEIFSSWGDLPESTVGPRIAIGLPESRQLSITYRYWRPVPCTRNIGRLPHVLRQGIDRKPSAKRQHRSKDTQSGK